MSNKPPIEVPQGAIRLNTDSQKLEFFAQDRWYEMATEDASPIAGRGIWGGGLQGPYASPYSTNIIDMVQIQTRGNATDFGDTTLAVTQSAGCGDRTRGLFMGGYWPSANIVINFITFATQGDSQDFGDTLQAVGKRGGFNNSTRGVVGGGGQDAPSPYGTTNVTEFVTIQSTGNAQDFGDLTVARDRTAGAASPTRGVIFQGYSSPSNQDVLDFFTTASTGNAVDFGDPTGSNSMGDATSNNIKGLHIGGGNPGVTTLDEIIFSTTGNAIEFGDMPLGGRGGGGAADATRAVMGRGISDTNYNNLFFVTIATRGNAMDFGDLTIRKGMAATTSNTNGGL